MRCGSWSKNSTGASSRSRSPPVFGRNGTYRQCSASRPASAREPDRRNRKGAAGYYGGHLSAVGPLFRNVRSDVDELAGEIRPGNRRGRSRCPDSGRGSSSSGGLTLSPTACFVAPTLGHPRRGRTPCMGRAAGNSSPGSRPPAPHPKPGTGEWGRWGTRFPRRAPSLSPRLPRP